MRDHIGSRLSLVDFFLFPATAPPEIYTLSPHDALPISGGGGDTARYVCGYMACDPLLSRPVLSGLRSEEHTSELQSLRHLVCRLLLEKKKQQRDTCRCDTNHLRRRLVRAASRELPHRST